MIIFLQIVSPECVAEGWSWLRVRVRSLVEGRIPRSLIGPNLINDQNKLKTRWGVEGMNKIL